MGSGRLCNAQHRLQPVESRGQRCTPLGVFGRHFEQFAPQRERAARLPCPQESQPEEVGWRGIIRRSLLAARIGEQRRRGQLAIGDGALGFWTALREVFATTREQRCWVHKTMNVLNALPKSLQDKAKGHLHDIWQAETKAGAGAAFDFFVETYGVKYDKAVAKLVKDREALLTFYDYPAEHWKHIRTSNPIESTFATVRHRTKRTKGCLSRRTGLAMAFKLMMSAQGKWRKLDGQNRLPEIIQGVEFRDGLRQLQVAA